MVGENRKADDASLHAQVLLEQLREHDKTLWIVVGGNLLTGILCFVIYQPHLPPVHLQLWFAALVVSLLFYVAASWRFRSLPEPVSGRWAFIFSLRAAFNGIIWGAFTFMMPADAVLVGVTCAIMTGLVGGAIGASIYFPPVLTFALPIMLALSWNLFALGGETYPLLAVAVLIYTGVVYLFGRGIVKNYVNFLWLRLKNEALVALLQDQKRMAEKANVDKSRFLAAASHDLRQPLHALGLFLNLLKKSNGDLDARLMRNIAESMDALKGLFDTLLDLSRLDAGMVRADMQPVRLNRLFAMLAQEFAPLAAEKGLKLRVVPSSQTVWSDPFLLESILRNLLSNALRYTEHGGIVMGCRRRGGLLSIEVVDSGIGIPPELQEKVFEEYFQVGNVERDRGRGLGLGLAIVQREAKLLGHRLSLRSQSDVGSCFAVQLERALDSADDEWVEPLHFPAESTALAGYTVLVIEDERDIRNAMVTLLEQFGCHAFVVESEADACVALKAEGAVPDFIVSDLRLRDGRTGIEAIEMVRSLFQKAVPALLVSGDTAPERMKEAHQHGLHLLHKPVDADLMFNEMCRRLLEGGQPVNEYSA